MIKRDHLWLTAALAGAAAAAGFGGLAIHARHSAASKAALTLAPCAPPPAGNHVITVDGARVPVLLHVPPGPAARRPLVLVLPAAGQSGHVVAGYTGYSRLADKKGFLVAYPTATGGRHPRWNVSGSQPGKPDDVVYLRHVITALTGPDGCANDARVGVTGVANGGAMAAKLACDAGDLLAAAAPVTAVYSSLPACRVPRRVPVLHLHGRVSGARRSWPGGASLRRFGSTARTWRFFLSAFRRGPTAS